MIALKKPMYIKTMSSRKPYCSSTASAGRRLSGRNVSRILLPSSGGKGSRLNTASDMFIDSRKSRNRITGSLIPSGIAPIEFVTSSTLRIVNAMIAIINPILRLVYRLLLG